MHWLGRAVAKAVGRLIKKQQRRAAAVVEREKEGWCDASVDDANDDAIESSEAGIDAAKPSLLIVADQRSHVRYLLERRARYTITYCANDCKRL